MVKISIIGGTGEFGRLFARIFKEDGFEVTITGRNRERGERVARRIGVRYLQDNIQAAKHADVVIISVSIENTLQVIEEVAPHLKPGSLLMDFTSVKKEPCRAMLRYASENVEIIGTHPMFGPRVTSLEGLVFIITPIRTKRWLNWLRSWLSEKKARVIETTPEEHDRIMSVVQGLTHFTYLSAASTLAELGIDVKQTRRFASPIYELMLDLIARIVGQNPRLYAGIQMLNPETKKVREVFVRQAERLQLIVDRGDLKGFTEVMKKAAKSLGDLEGAMGRSDKAINALTQELRKLKQSLGKEVALRHIYTGNVHVGRVEELSGEHVMLRRGRRIIKLKLANVELLPEEELHRWWLEHLPKESRDFSVVLPESARGEEICALLKKLFPTMAECRVIDVYTGKGIPEKARSITFRITGVRLNFEEVAEFFRNIGGKLRS